MDSSLPDEPRDPILRFRLRTLLAVTTVVAVLSAIAGPVYRIAPEGGRRNLLLFWTGITASSAISYFLRMREAFLRRAAHAVRVVVYSHTGKTKKGRILGGVTWLAFMAAGIACMTYAIGFDGRPSRRNEISIPLYWGFLMGSGIAGYIVTYVRRPLYLCEAGIPLAKGRLAPWKYIRGAEWITAAGNVMKLRRYDGDIYIEVPPAMRDEVEAFIREKIGADVLKIDKLASGH